MSLELNELDKYLEQLLDSMETRPRMYAANPGSFEDQYLLLVKIQFLLRGRGDRGLHAKFCRFLTTEGMFANLPAYAQISGDEDYAWDKLVELLKKFRKQVYS